MRDYYWDFSPAAPLTEEEKQAREDDECDFDAGIEEALIARAERKAE